MVREECCDGDVLDTRLAFFRQTLELGIGDSGDLFCSFFLGRLLGYKMLRQYKSREYRVSTLGLGRGNVLWSRCVKTSEDGFANTSGPSVSRPPASHRETEKAPLHYLVFLLRYPCPWAPLAQRVLL